ncbi:MAG: outer membrane beta-barrel protein [Bacteroidetes bacterium]|nr:outer membrane beta-barrel protein [Bacteroidota bacterium]
MMLSALYPAKSHAQDGGGGYAEAGFTIGPTNFLGDLGGNLGKGTTFIKDNNFSTTKIMVGAHITFYPRDWYGIRINMNFGSLEGDDAVIKGKGGYEEARRIRNQNFKTSIFETMVAGEIFPTVVLEEDPSDTYHKLRPYGVVGLGFFHFNPQGQDPATGQWVYLRPLHTEGQGFKEYPDRKEYSLWQMNVPLGIGIKYFMSDNFSLGLEVIHRKTFTDYMDDVSTSYIDPQLFYNYLPASTAAQAARMADKRLQGQGGIGNQRGNSKNNDSYYSFGLKLGWRIGGGDRWGNSTRCPTIRF